MKGNKLKAMSNEQWVKSFHSLLIAHCSLLNNKNLVELL
jgi:hypothetical protein